MNLSAEIRSLSRLLGVLHSSTYSNAVADVALPKLIHELPRQD